MRTERTRRFAPALKYFTYKRRWTFPSERLSSSAGCTTYILTPERTPTAQHISVGERWAASALWWPKGQTGSPLPKIETLKCTFDVWSLGTCSLACTLPLFHRSGNTGRRRGTTWRTPSCQTVHGGSGSQRWGPGPASPPPGLPPPSAGRWSPVQIAATHCRSPVSPYDPENGTKRTHTHKYTLWK